MVAERISVSDMHMAVARDSSAPQKNAPVGMTERGFGLRRNWGKTRVKNLRGA